MFKFVDFFFGNLKCYRNSVDYKIELFVNLYWDLVRFFFVNKEIGRGKIFLLNKSCCDGGYFFWLIIKIVVKIYKRVMIYRLLVFN